MAVGSVSCTNVSTAGLPTAREVPHPTPAACKATWPRSSLACFVEPTTGPSPAVGLVKQAEITWGQGLNTVSQTRVDGRSSNLVRVRGQLSNQTKVRLDRLRRQLSGSDQGVCDSPDWFGSRLTLPERRRQRQLSEEDLAAAKQAIAAGASVSEVARRYRVHHSTISDHLNRPEGPRKTPAMGPVEVEQAIDLYRSGLSFRAIGRGLGVHASTVRQYLLNAGVKPRSRVGQ